MSKLSVKSLLLLVLALPAAGSVAVLDWPLEGTVDLSSGFGDYRPGHFHFGIDLRTGGEEGKKVLSPVDGYVWRVRTSCRGYGKALYLRSDDGHVYVFGHLMRFAGEIEEFVRRHQVDSRRYSQDLELLPDSIGVKKGQLVALSGRTGASGPHLHLEKRTADNVPLNPLRNGFVLADETLPTINRVGFQMMGGRSFFSDGSRKMLLEARPGTERGRYVLDTVLYFNAPFGFLVDCFDQMRPGGMKQAVYDVRLYVDNRLRYRSRFDSTDFETDHSVVLEYDYAEAVQRRKTVRRLFEKAGNTFAGSSASAGRGIFGSDSADEIGLHEARIVAEDCFGNRSELRFRFLWGPPYDVFALDSAFTDRSDSVWHKDFFLTAREEFDKLAIDSVVVMLNRGDRWKPPEPLQILLNEGRRFVCRAIGHRVEVAVLRLILFTSHGAVIPDIIFNGLLERGPGRIQVQHEVVEDGLLVAVQVHGSKGTQARVELYHRDSLLGVEYPVYYHMNTHLCFIPPQDKYARIDRIGAALSRDTTYRTVLFDSVNIILLRADDDDWIPVDDQFEVRFGSERLYESRYIEFVHNRLRAPTRLGLNSDHYRIFPEAFEVRRAFDIRYRIDAGYNVDSICGLCWLDEGDNQWVWLGNQLEGRTLRTASRGGGSFAVVIDNEKPRIRQLSVLGSRFYADDLKEVSFQIIDTLSGIGEDAITVEVDGQWLIPEYNPYTAICRARLSKPLSPGEHHFAAFVTDRAGNRTEQYMTFNVVEGSRNDKRK